MIQFSVLMSVYAKEKPEYLHEAITSIWDGQILKPSQIVIVQDGPLNQELLNVLMQWQQILGDILTIIKLENNLGLGAALNIGLNHCKFDWVARMDSDDLSLPNRFKTQINFIKQNHDVDIFSAFLEEVDEFNRCQFIRKLPTKHEEIIRFAKLRSPINHPLAMFRKSVVSSVGGYPSLKKSQDYALWSILLQNGFQFRNIPEVLLKMRCGDDMLKRRGWEQFKNDVQVLKIQKKIGFISNYSFLKNLFLRFALRLAPIKIKSLIYKYVRG